MSESVLRRYQDVFIDTTVLLAIPVGLAFLHFFLPDAIYDQLVFTYGDANPVTAWTAAYLHGSNGHLYSNLAGYGIAIGFAYYLYSAYLQNRRVFWITVAILLAIVPPITTVVDYVVLYQHAGLLADGAVSKGFSGIVSAFGGMFLAAIGFVVADEYNTMTGAQTVLLIVLAALGVVTAANGILTSTIAGLLGFAIVLQGTAFISRTDLYQPSQLRTRVEQHAANIVQVTAYGAVVCIFVYLILPIEVVQSGNFVNILAHSVGFLVGVITAGLIYASGFLK
jgi:hypothetical protein